jgi:hypothetical protein
MSKAASSKKALAFGGIAAGAGLLYVAVNGKKKQLIIDKEPKKRSIPEYMKPLTKLVGEDTVETISNDPAWTELADRASEFYPLAVDEFKELLGAIANVVDYQKTVATEGKLTFGTPRLFRTKLHAVVEAVRNMRAEIELRSPGTLLDFDDVAADIQKAHDDAAYNMLLESSRY